MRYVTLAGVAVTFPLPINGKFWEVGRVLCVSLAVLLSPLVAYTQTTTIDFDPPTFAAGNVLGTLGDVTFLDGPAVFNSTVATTFSPPNALHSALDCTDVPCSDGAYMLRLNFSKPLASVTIRAGAYGVNNPSACFPENDTCNIAARLIGYDTSQPVVLGSPQGTAVADSGDVSIGNFASGPITTELRALDPCGRIHSVILFVGKGIIGPQDGGAARAQVDHLTFTAASGTGCSTNGPPTIVITAPPEQGSFSYPYHVNLTGTVTAPGGLFAFCTSINNAAMPVESQCNQRSLVSSTGNFLLPLTLEQLRPGSNSIFVFAYDLSGQSASASVAFSLLPPPAPTITITEPTADQLYNTSSVIEVGEMLVPGGLLAFCTGANEATPPAAAQCNQTSSVSFFPTTGQGYILDIPVPASQLMPGVNTIDAYVYDRFGQRGEAHVSAVLPASPRIVGMEVTQGIQTMSIPANIPGVPVPYAGANLYFGGKTVVRVFANTPAGTLPNVPAVLWASQGAGSRGRDLGVALASNGSLTLTPGGLAVSAAQRADPNGGYVFTLPWTFDSQQLCQPWESCISPTNGPLTLTAVLYSAADTPTSLCTGCGPGSVMTLFNVAFQNISPVTISPVSITWTGSDGVKHSPNPDPSAIFAATGNIFPPGPAGLSVSPYIGTMDISDFLATALSTGKDVNWMRGQALGRLGGFGNNDPPGHLVGVIDDTGSPTDPSGFILLDLGLTQPGIYAFPPRIAMNSVTAQGRPLTSVAHELFHQFNYYHAGDECEINEVFPAIGWPPDDRGDIQGIGLDRSKLTAGTYRIITPGPPDSLTVTSDGRKPCPAVRSELFDFMSYCACPDEVDSWTSIPNWNAWGSTFPNGLIPCGSGGCFTGMIIENSAPAGAKTTRVVASMDRTGAVAVDSVEPGDDKHLAAITNASDQTNYEIVVRDAAAQVVSRTHVTPVVSHQRAVLTADVLSTNAASIEIERSGAVVASRRRSANAPTISLVSPGPGAHLSGGNPTVVRWNAQDADGDPVAVRLEYSRDNGKIYRTLSTGLNGDRVSLPASLFARSHEARIRLRASDGFNETIVTSAKLSAEGTPPVPHIQEPVAGAHFRNDVALRLSGTGFSDSGKPLPSNAFHWFDGDRPLGVGPRLSVFDRERGYHTIRLVVDDDGRKGEVSVKIFIDAVAPTFMGLKVPEVVSHYEDEVRISVASSMPAVLVAGDQGFAVERKAKELRVRIPKGHAELRLPLVLIANGESSKVVVKIKRD